MNTKAENIQWLIENTDRSESADAEAIFTDKIIRPMLAMIDKEEDAEKVADEILKRQKPLIQEVHRKLYDELYTEDQIQIITDFRKSHPWATTIASEFAAASFKASEEMSRPIMEEVFSRYDDFAEAIAHSKKDAEEGRLHDHADVEKELG